MEKKALIKKEKRHKKITKKIMKKEIVIKGRNAGIDLLRILGMIDIVIFHILIDSNICTKYNKFRKELNLLNVFTKWHISIFGLISGVVGYKTCKYSNLLYLWLIVFFYSHSIHYAYKKYNPSFTTNNKLRHYLFPVIYNNHWYFSSYFGMYLFLPVINKGIVNLNKNEFTALVLSIIIVLVIWKDYMSENTDTFKLHNGANTITLIIFYIIGAYLGKFRIIENKYRRIYYYIICIVIFIGSGYITNYYVNKNYGANKIEVFLKKIYHTEISSFGMICQSASLILFFSQIKYNRYLGKIISLIGQLAFSVYIIHDHMDIRYVIYNHLFSKYSYNIPLSSVIYIIFLRGLQIFGICIIIDFCRHLLFKLLRIKTICVYVEKSVAFIGKKILIYL